MTANARRLDSAALSGVILVGGATRMPLVRQFVEKLFGRPPLGDIDPDQVVALGAAVQADVLAGGTGQGDMLLLDVVPLSLGLETMGGVVEKIIHRNTTVPAARRRPSPPSPTSRPASSCKVVQGERELADQCRSLAQFTLKGIPPMPAGMARLEVTFMVDADGILRVSAREETTGHGDQDRGQAELRPHRRGGRADAARLVRPRRGGRPDPAAHRAAGGGRSHRGGGANGDGRQPRAR